jgi:predicted nucleotidyltransferase
LVARTREIDGVQAIMLFGSYARGDQGRKSDVDLLFLVSGEGRVEARSSTKAILETVGSLESEYSLPMHLAPLVLDVNSRKEMGDELIENLASDAVVLFGSLPALLKVQPQKLTRWTLYRYRLPQDKPSASVKLSRRLHGYRGRSGLITPPALVLGRGALLIPAGLSQKVTQVLDECGATYDPIEIWRRG